MAKAATGPEALGVPVGDGSGSYGDGSLANVGRGVDPSAKASTGPEALGVPVGDGASSYGPAGNPIDAGYGHGNSNDVGDGRILSGPASSVGDQPCELRPGYGRVLKGS